MHILKRNTVRIILLAVSGGALVYAFAPYSLWWVTLFCPAILYTFLIRTAPDKALLYGFIFGVFFFGFGVPWTYNSIHEYGHAPVALSALLSGLLVTVLAIFVSLTSYVFSKSRFNDRLNILSAISYASLWTLFEWIRSWIFTGFPWLLLGHAHHSSPIKAIIPVFGTYGATFITLLFSCFLVITLLGNNHQRFLSALSSVIIILSLIVLYPVSWTHESSEKLNVALMQANIPQEMKWDRSNHPYILEKYMSMSKGYYDADIIVWPETAIPTYYSMVKDTYVKELINQTEGHKAEFLIGVFKRDSIDGEIYNAVMTLDKKPDFYKKQHLVPFGEYIPLRSLTTFFENYIQVPMSDLSRGQGRPLLKLGQYYVGTSICYEAVFGNEIIKALPEAQFLINVSNDAWFGESAAPHQHLEIARSRSIETGRYLLRATNTGISAVIDPYGNVLNKSAQFQEDIITAQISPVAGVTPFSKWGNWGIITLLFGVIFLILFIKRKQCKAIA